MLLLDSTTKDLSPWVQAFKEHLPDGEVVTWDEVRDPSKVEVAVVWNHQKDLFKKINVIPFEKESILPNITMNQKNTKNIFLLANSTQRSTGNQE